VLQHIFSFRAAFDFAFFGCIFFWTAKVAFEQRHLLNNSTLLPYSLGTLEFESLIRFLKYDFWIYKLFKANPLTIGWVKREYI